MHCSRLLIPPKKVLTLSGIEPEYPWLLVCSANHLATRPRSFQIKMFYILKNRIKIKFTGIFLFARRKQRNALNMGSSCNGVGLGCAKWHIRIVYT